MQLYTPTESKPSLLTFNEVTTLFHEFGHGLHGMLANTTTLAYQDFCLLGLCQLPSQVMETGVMSLKLWHYSQRITKTGEYSYGICKKNQRKREFSRRITTETVKFWIIDMGWHGQDPGNY
jgi:peptidyl-dipeptidase Dcp